MHHKGLESAVVASSGSSQTKPSQKPFRLQLALQGGGAKLAAHLAVMEGVEELVADGTIEVTRIAGTSAGELVGCLYGASHLNNRKIKDIAIELFDGGNGQQLFRKIRTWKTTALLRALANKPLWKPQHLERWLKDKFQTAKGPTRELKICDLTPKMIVVTTDLTSVEGKALVGDGEFVHNAVMKSAGLPYLLSKWGPNGPVFVDGGICENLPAGELANSSELYGPVVAFTFPPELEKNPRSYLKFAKAMLLSAMENSEHRAVTSLDDDQVHEIKTTLKTFDFDKAFAGDFRKHEYPQLKEAAIVFLRGYVKEQKRLQTEKKAKLSQKWWTDGSPLVEELLCKMGSIYHQQPRAFLRHHHVVLEVVAEHWQNPESTCSLYHRLEFSSDLHHIYGMEVSTVDLSQDGLMTNTDISVFDGDKKVRNFETFPMRDPGEPHRRSLGIFFLPPLPPGERFFIEVAEKAKLHPKDFDDLVYRTDRLGDYAIEIIDLVLHVPKGKNIIFIKHNESPEGESYDATATRSLKIKDFDAKGWKGKQIKLTKGQPFGVYIKEK